MDFKRSSILYPRIRKPPRGILINPYCGSSLINGLIALFPLNETRGLVVTDIVNNFTLSARNTTINNAWTNASMPALNLISAGGGFSAQMPSFMKVPYPLTTVIAFRNLTASTNVGTLVSLEYGSPTLQTPFNCATVYKNTNSNNLIMAFDSNNTGNNTGSIYTMSTNTDYVVSGNFTSPTKNLYVNGSLVFTSNITGQVVYSPTSAFCIGAQWGNNTQITNAAVYWVGFWNRTLTAAEQAFLGSSVNSIWSIFEPHIDYTALFYMLKTGQITRQQARVLLGNQAYILGQPSWIRR